MSPEFNNFNLYKRTKYTCFFTYLAMSSVFSLPPILFMTFREMYGISYTLLGTLILVNFCTQLTIDLIFSFFSKYFNIHMCVRTMPLLTCFGLLIYAFIPRFFPEYAYAGLLIGTIIFSVAAGLCEVLLSPLVAAIPSDNHERDMSLLHSLYAWGVLTVVILSTAYLKIFGRENWMYLTVFWAALPVISFVLFSISPLPDAILTQEGKTDTSKSRRKKTVIILCVICIFLGSATENAMTNWISGYMETALKLPKVLGDVLGMALFAVLLGLGRVLYARYGKNIFPLLFCSMIGSLVCYLVSAIASNPVVSIIACVLTGLFTSMLWPGTLILMEEKIPSPGITAYALMAAGGDLGGSVAPQLLGIVVDYVSGSAWTAKLSEHLSLSVEQIGMKAGMLGAAIFPLLGIILFIIMAKYFNKVKQCGIENEKIKQATD